MRLVDEAGWQRWVDNNQHDPGYAVFGYAERWADLMEAEMADGAKLEDIAERCSCEAKCEGITRAMYGLAVLVLAKCWEHGDRLRRWHNLRTQILDEGERANARGTVLNPAALCVGTFEGGPRQ